MAQKSSQTLPAAIVLAQVLHELYPQNYQLAKIQTDGPEFFVDFSLDQQRVSESDFSKIEKKIRSCTQQGGTIITYDIKSSTPKLPADNTYLKSLVKENTNKYLAVFKDTAYPVKNTLKIDVGKIGEIALTAVSGAYWKDDESNAMLNRLNGVAFATATELKQYQTEKADAEQRDHRRLGKEMDLFTFSDLVGPGLPLFTPNGALIRKKLQEFVIDIYQDSGYQEVHTPQITKSKLFETSGHVDKYRKNLFSVTSNYSDEKFFLKPMNCPMHTQIYASRPRSYKDLPIRYADFSNLYRDEKPGELSGLTRLRAFSQDDGHSLCAPDQIEAEVATLITLIRRVLATFEMKPGIRLSLWDPNNKKAYLGNEDDWERSQKQLRVVLKNQKIDFVEQEGEAAIYGPKIDFVTVDAMGREWQISTIQLDFIMPKNFKLTYTDKDGTSKTPVMIHRALLGSPERFMALILEHFSGALPTWLMPIQVAILPLSAEQSDHSAKLLKRLKENNIRAKVLGHEDNLNSRIKEAEQQKIPYMLIIGQREVADSTVSVRTQGNTKNKVESIDQYVATISQEISSRSVKRAY